jgi:OmpA-OmpF porin, OOP family
MNKILTLSAICSALFVSGCTSKQVIVEQPVLTVVTIPQPTFNILNVHVESDVVRIPTTEQTVVCNGCDQVSSGMEEGQEVVWIRLVQVKQEETIIDSRHFDFDKAILKGDLSKLRVIAQRLLDNPETDVDVVGHTDSVGSQKYNQILGQKRANAVKNWLIKQGVESKRINASSKGETQPIASNKTKKGRAENRRAVIVINIAE